MTATFSPASPIAALVDRAPHAIEWELQWVFLVVFVLRPAIAALVLILLWRRRDAVDAAMSRVATLALLGAIALSSYEIWIWWSTSAQ